MEHEAETSTEPPVHQLNMKPPQQTSTEPNHLRNAAALGSTANLEDNNFPQHYLKQSEMNEDDFVSPKTPEESKISKAQLATIMEAYCSFYNTMKHEAETSTEPPDHQLNMKPPRQTSTGPDPLRNTQRLQSLQPLKISRMQKRDQLGCSSIWLGHSGASPERLFSAQMSDLAEDDTFTNYVVSTMVNKLSKKVELLDRNMKLACRGSITNQAQVHGHALQLGCHAAQDSIDEETDSDPHDVKYFTESFVVKGSFWATKYQEALKKAMKANEADVRVRASIKPTNLKDKNAITFEVLDDGVWLVFGYCGVKTIPKLTKAVGKEDIISYKF
ncbi:hypothetical protein ACROYT_G014778 [Oculina patagonica]